MYRIPGSGSFSSVLCAYADCVYRLPLCVIAAVFIIDVLVRALVNDGPVCVVVLFLWSSVTSTSSVCIVDAVFVADVAVTFGLLWSSVTSISSLCIVDAVFIADVVVTFGLL